MEQQYHAQKALIVGLDFVLVLSLHRVGLIKMCEVSVESVMLNEHPGCTGSVCRCFFSILWGRIVFSLSNNLCFILNPFDSVPL